jgi:hypothetical protein
MTFTPTDEQVRALELFRLGRSMVIEAGAGTGKTATLCLLAEDTQRRGRYLAFNKSIVTDVAGKLPDRCAASTAHSLAFRSVGTKYAHRLNAGRMPSWQLARIIGVDRFVVRYGTQSKVLGEPYLGGLVMRSVQRFCQTADERPSRIHMPYVDGIDIPDERGRRTYANNNALSSFIEPQIERAWADLQRLDGQLPFKHEHYLKLWQLSHPHLDLDYVLFDEAQDANPVMAAVIAEQDHAQRVYVGDANQAIYEFTGAVNSIEEMKLSGLDTRMLSQSFRFGDAIAAKANVLLAMLKSDLRLTGYASHASTVGSCEDAGVDAILCRTNAGALHAVLNAQRDGVSAFLVGGGGEVASFARAAQKLMDGEIVFHPELACFSSWGEVLEYTKSDAQGHELRLMVNLVEEFTVETILDALDKMPSERASTLCVSTAHKAKGREWSVVRIDADFLDAEPNDSELRLRYVAVTRARTHLDDTVFQRKDSDASTALPATGERIR